MLRPLILLSLLFIVTTYTMASTSESWRDEEDVKRVYLDIQSLPVLEESQGPIEKWVTPERKVQIDSYLEMRDRYGSQLGDFEKHIPELTKFVNTTKEYYFSSKNSATENLVLPLFLQVDEICKNEKLSFPRFKIFLCALQLATSKQEWGDRELESASLLQKRPNRIWYSEPLSILFEETKTHGLSMSTLENCITSQEKTIIKDKEGVQRRYNNLLVSFVESASSIPLIGRTACFGYVDANYAMMNGLYPYGFSFAPSPVHNGFHWEPIDVFFHDLIHIEYVRDVTTIYSQLSTLSGRNFFQLLQTIFEDSCRGESRNFIQTQYALFLLLHDPDPVQFNKLRNAIITCLEKKGELKKPKSEFSVSCLKDAVTHVLDLTLRKYYVTNSQAFTPNEVRVALYDVVKTFSEIGFPVGGTSISRLSSPSLTLEEYTPVEDEIRGLVDNLFISTFFENKLFDQTYIINVS